MDFDLQHERWCWCRPIRTHLEGSIGQRAGHRWRAGHYGKPTLSPDGTWVAIDVSDPRANNLDIWIETVKGSSSAPFTLTHQKKSWVCGRGREACWLTAGPTQGAGRMVKQASGMERGRKTYATPIYDDIIPNSWTVDDRQILCTHQTPSRNYLELISVADGNATPLLNDKDSSQTNGQISPDGKWVACA